MAGVQYFLGANSSHGFYSLYDELLPRESAAAIYYLKGGPGCGKSTLMNAVGRRARDAGLDAEYILCSGDPDSLDGIVIPALGVAVADGTAPHILEPLFPGAVEHYVNLGDCYDTGGLSTIREELMAATLACKVPYAQCYQALAAAAAVGRAGRLLLSSETLQQRLVRRGAGILARECKKTGDTGGKTLRFLSGITCEGHFCLWDTVEELCPRVYALSDSYGLGGPLLETLLAGAVESGYHVISCPSPLEPERLEHLLIPSLGLAFVTDTPALPYPHKPYRHIRVDAMADEAVLRQNKGRLKFVRKVTEELLQEGIVALSEAKKRH
ncbi:MAG: hypothetical protein RR502_06540, partial [Oscillospiraceae bacterium]